ncbi:helix-turn-helix domain-containing protein [Streptomyces sp. NBC_00433]
MTVILADRRPFTGIRRPVQIRGEQARFWPSGRICLARVDEVRELLMPTAQFTDAKETAEYLNMSVQWVYREAPRVGLVPYKFGRGMNAKIQFKVSEVQAWARQRRTAG